MTTAPHDPGGVTRESPVVVTVNTWAEFSQRIRENIGEFLSDRFIFRGQRSSTFPLESSFDRRYGTLPFARRRTIESTLLALYKDAVVRHELGDSSEVSPALGQHFGLPTRWLDWTESRYIAAFFAFAGLEDVHLSHMNAAEVSTDVCVSVYALDAASPLIDDERLRLIAPKFSTRNRRLTAQLGLFLQNRTQQRTVEGYVREYLAENSDANEPSPLYRFDIPVREARVALRDLAEMGISYARLFPGLEGAAREAKLDEWLGTPPPRERR